MEQNRLLSLLEQAQGSSQEPVKMLDINHLIPFENQPFKLYSDEKMSELVKSISDMGIITPLIVRNVDDEHYQIIAGHNRWEAAKKAGLKTVPAIIREMDDADAMIILVDTNFHQREQILPSEKAFAYQMKLNALKQQGKKNHSTSRHRVAKWNAADIVGQENQTSGRQIQRYIRLTMLIPSLLLKVDQGTLGFIPAVDISYLNKKYQIYIDQFMEKTRIRITKTQAAELKKRNQENILDLKSIEKILDTKTKKEASFSSWNPKKTFKSYLPTQLQKELTANKADEILKEALTDWLTKYQNRET